MQKTENVPGQEITVRPIVKRYFGFATYAEYFEPASRPGHSLQGLTLEQAWDGMMKDLNFNKPHITSAEWIRAELQRNPDYKSKAPVWYWVMSETRAMVPAELLAVVDSCGAGIK